MGDGFIEGLRRYRPGAGFPVRGILSQLSGLSGRLRGKSPDLWTQENPATVGPACLLDACMEAFKMWINTQCFKLRTPGLCM